MSDNNAMDYKLHLNEKYIPTISLPLHTPGDKKTRTDFPPRPTRLQQLTKSSIRHTAYVADQTVNILRHYASWMGYLQNFFVFTMIPSLILRVTDLISPAGRIISGLKLLNNLIFRIRGPWSRLLSLVASISGIVLGVAAIAIPALGMTFAAINIVSNNILGFWTLGVDLRNKLYGKWRRIGDLLDQEEKAFYSQLADPDIFKKFRAFKLKENKPYDDEPELTPYTDPTILELSALEESILLRRNQVIQLNMDITNKAYNCGVMLLALLGITLVFSAPTFMAGMSILLGTSIHGVIYGYDLAGVLPQVIQNCFLPTASDTIEELEARTLPYKKSSTAATELALKRSKSMHALFVPLAEEPEETKVEENKLETDKGYSPFWQRLIYGPPEDPDELIVTPSLDISVD